MQEKFVNSGWLPFFVIVAALCAFILVIGSFTWMVPVVPTIPTAEDIASKIVIPEPVIPESVSTEDIVVGIYEGDVEELEIDVQNALLKEYKEDFEDDIQDLIEDEEDDDVKIYFGDTEFNYRESYEFTIINLGLDDEEDRAGQVDVTIKVRYMIVGEDDYKTDKIYVTGTASDWDKVDNEFEDVKVTYSLTK